jgi:hypothetical protein
MASKAKYKYAVSYTSHGTEVNELMQSWAEAGWDLVSGNVSISGNGTMFAMYWRKPIEPSSQQADV